ncbi:MAG: T9SS type A sorting domain-containing protein [Bacteroidetes bacterium]|nr:T9SS type A sorting domain-containing protein [Bacteroidota bacterium]
MKLLIQHFTRMGYCRIYPTIAILHIAAAALLSAQPVTWKTAQHYQDYYIWNISCTDDSNCFAVASYQQTAVSMILRTTNGGLTWDSVYSERQVPAGPRIPTYVGVARPTRSRAIVVADSGLIIRTTDGGATWRRQRIAGRSTIAWISMADSMHGLVGLLASPNSLMATGDGGETWDPVAFPDTVQSMGVTDVAMPTPTTFVALMSWYPHNAVVRSDDRGATWRVFPNALPDSSAGSLWFNDSLHGWAAGDVYTGVGDNRREVISRTTDGGATWTTQLNAEVGWKFGLTDIAFTSPDSGLAVGGIGTILRTADGGAHWTVEPNDLTALQVLHVAYPRGSRGIVVTTVGRVALPADLVPADVVPDANADDGALPATCAVYPNPVANTSLTVLLPPSVSQPVHVVITDVMGRVARTLDAVAGTGGVADTEGHELHIDMSGIPAGAYMVHLSVRERTFSRIVYVVR